MWTSENPKDDDVPKASKDLYETKKPNSTIRWERKKMVAPAYIASRSPSEIPKCEDGMKGSKAKKPAWMSESEKGPAPANTASMSPSENHKYCDGMKVSKAKKPAWMNEIEKALAPTDAASMSRIVAKEGRKGPKPLSDSAETKVRQGTIEIVTPNEALKSFTPKMDLSEAKEFPTQANIMSQAPTKPIISRKAEILVSLNNSKVKQGTADDWIVLEKSNDLEKKTEYLDRKKPSGIHRCDMSSPKLSQEDMIRFQEAFSECAKKELVKISTEVIKLSSAVSESNQNALMLRRELDITKALNGRLHRYCLELRSGGATTPSTIDHTASSAYSSFRSLRSPDPFERRYLGKLLDPSIQFDTSSSLFRSSSSLDEIVSKCDPRSKTYRTEGHFRPKQDQSKRQEVKFCPNKNNNSRHRNIHSSSSLEPEHAHPTKLYRQEAKYHPVKINRGKTNRYHNNDNTNDSLSICLTSGLFGAYPTDSLLNSSVKNHGRSAFDRQRSGASFSGETKPLTLQNPRSYLNGTLSYDCFWYPRMKKGNLYHLRGPEIALRDKGQLTSNFGLGLPPQPRNDFVKVDIFYFPPMRKWHLYHPGGPEVVLSDSNILF